MSYRLFLVAALLFSFSSGESSVHGPPKTVLAFAGGDVILPCSFSIPRTDEFPTVEWSKEGLLPDKVIFLYRDGCEDHAMKNPAFRYRTSFISKELQNGNISLRISNVQLSDAGKYQCMRLWSDAPRDITDVELVVGAVSEPKLTLTSEEGGGVTLQCEANCWLPEPEVTFLDDQGNDIRADDPKRDPDTGDCFTVRRRVTLQEAPKSVTCRVHQPEINQTRDKEMIVSVDGGRSCFVTTIIAVGGTILILSAPLCVLAAFFWKRHVKSAKEQKLPVTRQSSEQSRVSATSENESLLQSVKVVKVDNMGNLTIEMLTKEVADLNSKLHEREETIRQLQDNKPQPSPAVCQHAHPAIPCGPAATADSSTQTFDNVPQIRGRKPGLSHQSSTPAPGPPLHRTRRNSCPVFFNFAAPSSSSSAGTSVKKLGHIGRSMSDPRPSLKPSLKPKLQRQHSLVLSSSQHLMLLADVAEESD